MRITVQVGAVAVDLRGVDMSTRAIRALIDQCARPQRRHRVPAGARAGGAAADGLDGHH